MRTGRKPTPTKVLTLRGSWRANTRRQEPRPTTGKPICPAWLSPEAKRTWRHLVPQLVELGLATRLDGGALARYCVLYARWRTLEDWLVDHIGDPGYGQYGFAANSLQKELAHIENAFGLSPQARAGLGIALEERTPHAPETPAPDAPPAPRRFLRLG